MEVTVVDVEVDGQRFNLKELFGAIGEVRDTRVYNNVREYQVVFDGIDYWINAEYLRRIVKVN